MVHHEGFLLGVWDVIPCDIDNGLPMSFLDRWLLQLEDDGEHLLIILDLLLELGIGLPGFQILWKADAMCLELFDIVHPLGDHVDINFCPKHISPII